MGISASKRVRQAFLNSSEFSSACSATFIESLSLTQHAFQGILPYQLHDASLRLHQSLSSTSPLVKKWAPSPPSQLLVDATYKSLRRQNHHQHQQPESLGSDEFKDFAVELFTGAVVSNAQKAVLTRIPMGIAGIAGVGVAGKIGKEFVGAVIGAYALGVATSVYISLG